MNSTIETAVALLTTPTLGEAIADALSLIEDGQGGLVFDAMVEELAASSDADAALTAEFMRLLETIIDVDVVVGTYLMARLSALAGRKLDHQTCDAIDLWMHNGSGAAAAEILEQLSAEGVRPRLAKRCAAWAADIRGR